MPVTCFLCGRDFGRRSITIHLAVCRRKWAAEQARLPEDAPRRPEPEEPRLLARLLAGEELTAEELEEHNAEAATIWSTEVLVSCENCGRSFFPDKIEKHQKCCTPAKPMQNLNRVKGNASKMEALMKIGSCQQDHKTRKLSRELTNSSTESDQSVMDDNDDVIFQKTCRCKQYKDACEDGEVFVPILEDFVQEIEQSGILKDQEKSRQLLMLMQLFISVKDENKNDNDTSLVLPPIK